MREELQSTQEGLLLEWKAAPLQVEVGYAWKVGIMLFVSSHEIKSLRQSKRRLCGNFFETGDGSVYGSSEFDLLIN